MFSRPKILFLVSLLFVALLNPKFNPYLLFKFLIFYHSSGYCICLTSIISVLISVTSVPRRIWLLYLAYQYYISIDISNISPSTYMVTAFGLPILYQY